MTFDPREVKLSVVIPNFNGSALLAKNLPSLFEALGGFRSEVIVVDDASTDDSSRLLLEAFPSVVLLQNKSNQGFSATCNRGIFFANGHYTCIANTDVTFSSNYFRVAFDAMEQEDLFAIKGLIVNHKGDVDQPTNLDTTAVLFLKRGFLRFDKTEDNRAGLMSSARGARFALLGCCFVARSAELKTLGGFDTLFSPFYWEDSDLPLRAVKKGLRVRYLPEAVVFHEQGATIDVHRRRWWRKLVSDRNKFLFSWRHFECLTDWFSHAVFVVISLLTRWIKLEFGYYIALSWALYLAVFGSKPIRLRPASND